MPKLIEIRSWLPEHQSGQIVATLGGHALPTQVGATLASPWRVLCVAPAQWLLICEQGAPEVDQQGLVLTDVTDGISRLTVRGPTARDVLSKSCGLDLDPDAFPVGRCARTRFAQLSVTIDCLDSEPVFDLYVSRSYQHSVSDWLEDAALEFDAKSP